MADLNSYTLLQAERGLAQNCMTIGIIAAAIVIRRHRRLLGLPV